MATTHVPAGGNLQTALNAAAPGDTITLEPGALYEGNFTLPVHGGASYVTVRSAALDSALPAAGYRMRPTYAAQLPRLRGGQASNLRQVPCLKTAHGAQYWRLMFLEIDSNYWGDGEMIALGVNDTSQTEWAQQPSHIVLDRCYIHGDPLWGQKRGVGMHGKHLSVINCWFDKFASVLQDSSCIGGGNGEGPYVVVNNRLEGGTENFILGGDKHKIATLTTVLSSPQPTTSAFRLASTARLRVGLHMYFKMGDTVRGEWSFCQSIDPATGDVTINPPLSTPPPTPGEVQWGAIPSGITFRRNYILKPIEEMTEAALKTPQGLAGTPAGGGSLASGTYNYVVQARHSRGYGGNPIRSIASAAVAVTVGANSVVNLTWAAVPYAETYRVHRQAADGSWQYKDTADATTLLQDTGLGWTTGAPAGGSMRVHKCLFEFKTGYNWQIDSNVMENHWRGSDSGFAVWLKSNSQDGKEPFNHADDIVFEKNLLRHVYGFASISGRINTLGKPASTLPDNIQNIVLRENLVFDNRNSPYGQGQSQYVIALQNGVQGAVIEHNTIVGGQKGIGFFNTNATYGLLQGIRIRSNMMTRGTYGLRGQSAINTNEGTLALEAYTLGDYEMVRNALADVPSSLQDDYPADNDFPTQAAWEAEFVDYGGGISGDYHLKPTSKYRTTYLGHDGKPVGADIAALLIAVRGVEAGDPEIDEGGDPIDPDPEDPGGGSGGGGGSDNTLLRFSDVHALTPQTGYATRRQRGSHGVMEFADGATEVAYVEGFMPRSLGTAGVTVSITWAAASDTTIGNAVRWGVSLERLAGATSLDADAFGVEKLALSAPQTVAGKTSVATVSFGPSELEGALGGEAVRIRVRRLGADAGDTVVGAAHLLRVEVKRATP